MVIKLMRHFFLYVSMVGVSSLLVASEAPTAPVVLVGSLSSEADETEQLVKDVQKDLEMEGFHIEVESGAKGFYGCVELCPMGYYVIYLDELWLKTLTPDAQRFIIGHELMHVKLGHSFNHNFVSNLFDRFCGYFSRQRERDADYFSALELKNAQGAIDAIETMVQIEKEGFAKKKLLFIMRTLFYKTIASHPKPEERLELVKDLMASPEYKKKQVV
jgi:hypothetical protein